MSSLDLVTRSPNKLWRGKDGESTTLLVQLACAHTVAVRIDVHCSRMMLTLAVVFGPAATKWYGFLQNNIKLKSHNATIAARVLADQVVFATCNLAIFLSTMSILEGTDPKEKLAKSYLPGLKANWTIWPAVQAVNFKLVPLEHRVLVVNVVSLGWNCYLSYLNSS